MDREMVFEMMFAEIEGAEHINFLIGSLLALTLKSGLLLSKDRFIKGVEASGKDSCVCVSE